VKAVLVIAATNSSEVHERVWRAAKQRGVLCNVVDDPTRCDFFCGAVVRRGSLQIAISTGGRSPALAQQLRRHLERQFGTDYAKWVEALGLARRRALTTEPDAKKRKQLAHKLAHRVIRRARLQKGSGE
jgi:siroheme synthase-like protein